MPVVVVATLLPLAEHRDEVIELVRIRVAEVHSEPGCQLYALHDAGDELVIVEQWADEKALEMHAAGRVTEAYAEGSGREAA